MLLNRLGREATGYIVGQAGRRKESVVRVSG
jgi:hypothetical protein